MTGTTSAYALGSPKKKEHGKRQQDASPSARSKRDDEKKRDAKLNAVSVKRPSAVNGNKLNAKRENDESAKNTNGASGKDGEPLTNFDEPKSNDASANNGTLRLDKDEKPKRVNEKMRA